MNASDWFYVPIFALLEMEMQAGAIKGLRVLIVEDNFLLATSLANTLTREGAIVIGPVSNVRDALAALVSRPDCASLDVDLGQETSFAVADALAAAHVPFLFCTGTAMDIPEEHQSRPICAKPYTNRTILDLFARMLAG